MRFTKWTGILVAAFLLTAPLAGYGAQTIKLGIGGAHTGDLAGYGVPALNAAKLVVEKVNASGGIHGMMVEIVQQDDQCKPELSTNAATKLIAGDIRIVMGHTCSGANKAALPLYEDKKIVSISPSATSPELTQSGRFPHFFRTIPSDDAQARLGVDFAIQALGAKKIALLHDKGDYGKGYCEFAKKFIEEGSEAKVVFFEGITPGAVDYSSAVQKIARSGADTLIFGGYYPEASKLVTAIRARGMKINFVSEDGVKTEKLLELAGKDAEGVYASSNREYGHLPITQEAVARHKEVFGTEPGQFFELAYAATQALLNAVDKAGGDQDPEAIMKALRTEYVETPVGKIRFDERGDCEGAGFAMFRVVDGKFVDQKFEAK
ncbi:branched-chain amino acid ABC transporter substrate-binding protein [Desulfovibrio sp. OttesenSCG-928-A18]|nr:branched-chain amino acid ABC transporter substrate-binding protein [Desulfovibrio sp. OttesenSCG-928-A18]